MKKLKYQIIISIFFLAILFSSCTTLKPGVIEPFGIIGMGADIYAYIPTNQNKELFNELIKDTQAKNDIKMALGKTKAIYLGIFLHDTRPEIRICAIGSYPYKLSDSIFKTSNGWKASLSENRYKYYEARWIDVSIPNAVLACANIGPEDREKMTYTLSRIDAPKRPIFKSNFNDPIVLATSKEIKLYSTNPNYLLEKVVGVNLELPLETLELSMQKDKNKYNYSFIIRTSNASSTFVMTRLLKKSVKGNIKVEGYSIIVENQSIEKNRLVEMLKSLYIGKKL